MNEDMIFRVIVIAMMLSAFLVSAYHRRKAQGASGDEIDRRQEGGFIMVALRVGGGLIWLMILAYMVYPPAINWATLPLPSFSVLSN